MSGQDTIRQILDLGRWAPSGDNTQPWRFEIAGPSHVIVHGFDTREHCVYDLDGHASQISIGALLETISIAASDHGLRLTATRRKDVPDSRPVFDLIFVEDQTLTRDPLVDHIRERTVQRKALSSRTLTLHEKSQLEGALPDGYEVQWIEGAAKWRAALLLFHSAKLRLTTPEAYQVHRDIIDWSCRFSPTKVPDQALGVDPLTIKLMRFVMKDWKRVEFFNRYFAGTWAPRIQMDFVPSIKCGAHFALSATKRPDSIDDYVAAGRAVQRLWLQTTALGLLMQPEVTPLVFARYAELERKFSEVPGTSDAAKEVASALRQLLGSDKAQRTAFMGRVGEGHQPKSRSLRIPLAGLLTD